MISTFSIFNYAVSDRCDSTVAQVSKPAVSPTSKSAELTQCVAGAGLETRDTADLEVCATIGLLNCTRLMSCDVAVIVLTRHRQLHGECAALSWLAVHNDSASVRVDNEFDDAQAQTATLGFACQ